MPAPRFGETDEEVQNEAQKSILRVFHALILSDFFGASALTLHLLGAHGVRECPACFLILKGVVISSHETNRFS